MQDSIRTLVVDDSIYAQRALKLILEDCQNIKVVGTADSGDAALREVERLKPDLVLMDVNMPGMDGLEATARIVQQFPQTRVIVVTANDSVEARRACLVAGANGFVSKDRICDDLLFEVVRVFIKMESSQVRSLAR